jgi:cobyrinic acid a,c-diamide synthase
MKGFIIAGTSSGCGKTTVTMGLMALLRRSGLKVAPFKTGPDFIDPVFHEFVTGSSSYNLDSFMLGEDTVKYLYHKHTAGKDIAVVEGVMGLYDGIGPDGRGSAAELSQVLGLPVILVVSCKATYQSVAAMVLGFKQYKQGINICGVILNHVSSHDQYMFLKEIIERTTLVPCIGYLPFKKELAIESRHLGLLQAEEVEGLEHKINVIADAFSRTISLDWVKALANVHDPIITRDVIAPLRHDLRWLHLGVAYDKAFRFYYRDNLELLQECGATLHYFSPLDDVHLPDHINALYIGGGYPEVFASGLSFNESMRKEINEKAALGLPVYAECGGLMYLTKAIVDEEKEFAMAGVFNCTTKMTKSLQRFGYAKLVYQGAETLCHEFHHSLTEVNDIPDYELAYHLQKPMDSTRQWQCGLSRNNVLAGYAHVHFYSSPSFFTQIINLWNKAIM